MDQTDQILKQQVANAPKQIRSYLREDLWTKVVSEIGLKNNLTPEQKTNLENEVLFVLISLEFKGDFQKNIQENVKIPELLARDIAKEVYEKIFKQVESFLPTGVDENELPPANNLIEDSAGNADNVKPIVTPQQSTAQPSPTPVKIPTVNVKVSPATSDEPKKWWEELPQPPAPTTTESVQETKKVNWGEVVDNTTPDVATASSTQATPPQPQPTQTSPNLSQPLRHPVHPIKEPLNILERQQEMTTAEKTLSKLAGEEGENKIIKKDYGSQDPYREPIN